MSARGNGSSSPSSLGIAMAVELDELESFEALETLGAASTSTSYSSGSFLIDDAGAISLG